MKRHPPRILVLAITLFTHPGNRKTLLGDLEEEYRYLAQEKGTFKADFWYLKQFIRPFLHFILNYIFWSFIMLRNYLKIALRNIRRHKGYHFINIAGLAIGMACAILILLYVEHELSYDKYHLDAGRIYRIANEQVTSNGNRYYSAIIAVMGPALKERFPQVEEMARIVRIEPRPVSYEDKIYMEEQLAFVDPTIFKMFKVETIRGDFENALIRPMTVIITESLADKYFGAVDPIGKMLVSNGQNFEVTGLISDPPENTHFKYGILGAFSTLLLPNPELPEGYYQSWNTGAHSSHTYLKLADGTDLNQFMEQVNALAYEKLKEELAQNGYEHHYFLQRLTDIHLQSHLRHELETPGNAQSITVLTVVGVLILLLACINFMNLSTARSAQRACEVGMRKVVGARRHQLIAQFIGESICMVLLTLVFAVILVALSIQFFNSTLGTQLALNTLYRPVILFYVGLLVIATSVASGSYPAFLLSSFKPIAVLRKSLTGGRKGTVARKVLATGQIAISIVLIIGSLVITRQISYMKNVPLGFDMEQKLIVMLPDFSMMTENYENIKAEYLKHPGIQGATASSSVPGRWMFYWRLYPTGMRQEKSQPLNFLNVDYDFLDLYKMDLIAGRTFDRSFGTDLSAPGWVINEAAVEAYGWESPEDALGIEMMDRRTPIIGVVKNFHFKGLQNVVEPLAMSMWSDHFRCFTLQVDVNTLDAAMPHIESVYQKFFPGALFDYFFLDVDFNRHYRSEEQIRTIFSVFTSMGIIIAILGLFGLTAFIAEQRTREIGVRKVFGASVSNLVISFSKEFGKWVLVANVIAWPLAYLAARQWLQNFAYRTSIGIDIFFISGIVAFLIAMFSTGFQILKAARSNPVDSLRYE